jgi:hypothetical protein
MPFARAAGCVLALLSLASAGRAVAQPVDGTPPPLAPAAAAPAVAAPAVEPPASDAALRAVGYRRIAFTLRDGRTLVADVLGHDEVTITVARADGGAVTTLARADVVGMRLAEPSIPPASLEVRCVTPAAEPPAPPRHFGLQLGLAPSVMLDYQRGRVYVFANADFALPLASDGQLVALSTGIGPSFPISRSWHFSPMVFFASTNLYGNWSLVGGFALGLEYTRPNGFTLGFMVPVIGYSGVVASSRPEYALGLGSFAAFYLGSLMALPVFSFGVRL